MVYLLCHLLIHKVYLILTVFVDDNVVVVPVTSILPATVKLPATLKPSPPPISTLVESFDLITLPAILIEPAVKSDIPAIVVALAPKLIDVVPTVTAEFDKHLLLLPDKFEFVKPDIVLLPLIVLFVSVFVVPENNVSNCDNNTLPSVPPSDNNILSPATSV